jgi:solute carrier family 13 (sodium-dependent dicarboxylate transporter), member 2/3/5
MADRVAPHPGTEEGSSRFRPLPAALGLAAAIAVYLIPIPGLEPRAQATLAILTLAAAWWMTEALPVPVTALFIPVLGIALGVFPAKEAFAGFGDPIVFLFLGTFLLTDAAASHGLNQRLARGVLGSRWVRVHPTRMIWAVAFLGCAISAWANNTATTAMLLPLALSAERFGAPRLLTATLLMCSYAPSLGGLATPVGTAPNLIGLRLIEQHAGVRPSFASWCAVFAPLAIVGTAITGAWLTWRMPRNLAQSAPELPSSGPWSRAERTLVPLFVIVILLWITPGILAATPLASAGWVKAWQTRLPEPAVPIAGALLLFMLPAGDGRGSRILDVGVFRRLDWGTLMLFGGGLSLGAMMFDSGLARALGEWLFHHMPVPGLAGIVLASAIMAVVVSELTSNTASASLVVPVVLALAQAAGVDPVKPALAATVACSFGFMLPVSTPPNALVFGTGRVRIRDMISHGVLLDVVGVLLVFGWVLLFA